jgi:TonB family protein
MIPHEWLAEWSRWAWPLLAEHLWQATLFTLVALAAAALLKRAPARARHTIWLLALGKFLLPAALLIFLGQQCGLDLTWRAPEVIPPLPSVSFILVAPVTEPISPAPAMASISEMVAPAPPGPPSHAELYCALTIAWLLGALGMLALWGKRRARLAQALRAGRRVEHGREAEALARVRAWLLIRREITLIISPRITVPGVWRWRKPVVLWPEGMADRLSDEELEAVMMHELIHVLRGDNLLSRLQTLLCSLCWFHPLVWLIDRRLLAERELACDEQVIRLGGAPKLYARSLWKVMQFGLGWPVAGVSRAAGSNLRRRIELMLTVNHQTKFAPVHRALTGVTVTALAILALAAGSLSREGTLAQTGKSDQQRQGAGEGSKEARVSRGVSGGVSGGVGSGVVGGVSGGVVGGVADGVPGGMGVSGGVSGGVGYGVGGGAGIGTGSGVGGVSGIGAGDGTGRAVTGNYVTQSTDQDRDGQGGNQKSRVWEELAQAPSHLIRIEEAEGAPLLITEAHLRAVKDDEARRQFTPQMAETSDAYRFQVSLTLLNQTPRRITGIAFELRNPGLRNTIYIERVRLKIEPHDSFTYGKDTITYATTSKAVVDFPHQMSVKLVGVQFETEPHWGKPLGTHRQRLLKPVPNEQGRHQFTDEDRRLMETLQRVAELHENLKERIHTNVGTRAARFQDAEITDLVELSSVSERPKITYKEPARYTDAARAARLSGMVLLSAIFRSDGTLTGIHVIRGMPAGLTESAIQAAQSIRFTPALKDGRPVSVRVNLEFSFQSQ